MTTPTGNDPLAGEPLCALVGPTASGKSALALEIAARAGAEIVSLDSMQVYTGMDVGTAKPLAAERARVAHHMLDLVLPSERYDVQRWLRELRPVLDGIRARGRRALFTGGTGLWLQALVAGLFEGPDVDRELRERIEARVREQGSPALHAELAQRDPRSAARIHPNDAKRIVRALEVLEQTGRPLSEWQTQWSAPALRTRRLAGLELPVAELDRRIVLRTRALLAAGWPEEAARIRATCGFGPTAIQALGYAEALELFDGSLAFDAAAQRIAQRTRQLARRQRTWYRRFRDVHWISPESRAPADLADEALRALGW